MKKILLSTAVISAITLLLVGCGSSSSNKKVLDSDSSSKGSGSNIVVESNTNNNNLEEKADSQNQAQLIPMKTTNALSFPNYTISKISGENKDKFSLVKGSIYVKSINMEAGDYPVKLTLVGSDNSVISQDFIIRVSVDDKEAPTFLLPSSMEVAGRYTLSAENESESVIYSTNSHDFTISGTTLTAPDTAGDYNLTVFAEDTSGNKSQLSTNVKVTASSGTNSGGDTTGTKTLVFDTVLDSRVDHTTAMHICPNGKRLPTIDELMSNIPDLYMATQGLDSNPETAEVKFSSVIWSSTVDDATSSYGVYFIDGTATNYKKESFENNATYFYTCVPK
jgi:hypothetical protein